MAKLVFLDTETGGLNPDTDALLTIGFTITDEVYNILTTEEYKLPILGRNINESALAVNGLDMGNRNNTSKMADIVKQIATLTKGSDVALLGHNIRFDLNFIRSVYPEEHSLLMKLVNRNIIDTKSIMNYLKLKGLYDGSTSMHSIMGDNEKHTAGGDTVINVGLLKKIDEIVL